MHSMIDHVSDNEKIELLFQQTLLMRKRTNGMTHGRGSFQHNSVINAETLFIIVA